MSHKLATSESWKLAISEDRKLATRANKEAGALRQLSKVTKGIRTIRSLALDPIQTPIRADDRALIRSAQGRARRNLVTTLLLPRVDARQNAQWEGIHRLAIPSQARRTRAKRAARHSHDG
jgi:hypothetical protein